MAQLTTSVTLAVAHQVLHCWPHFALAFDMVHSKQYVPYSLDTKVTWA